MVTHFVYHVFTMDEDFMLSVINSRILLKAALSDILFLTVRKAHIKRETDFSLCG